MSLFWLARRAAFSSSSALERWSSTAVKALKEAISITPSTWSSTTIGRMIRLPGVVWPRPEEMM